MGYIKHETIIITGWDLEDAYNKAKELFPELTSNIVDSAVNQYSTFMVAADGSKEGWEDSNKYDLLRIEFCDYLDSLAYSDGSGAIDFVWVSYDEERHQEIVRTNAPFKF